MPKARAVFLTGATGLLGRYLLRNLLAAGRRVVVLVRDHQSTPAEDRIGELVDSWGSTLGRPLPRPLVLNGELGPDEPGLGPTERHCLTRHCQAVLHAAADLSFRTTRDDEPWRTNVAGTEALLRLCRTVGLSELHHVSTAFVCGRRRGTVHEDELDCGQEFHNPYEQSKHEAEGLVRRAAGMRVTVYRPAVIVGDSETGYTSTYGGLYRFLGLAARLGDTVSPTGPRCLPLRLPVRGDEPCNLVPVDWVARSVLELLARPQWHGRTFHLAGCTPVPTRLLYEVAAQELGLEGVELVGPEGVPDRSRLEQAFLDGTHDYWPYLGGAPLFDCANLTAALPHLPAPAVDGPMLRRLIRFAVADRWGRGSRPPTSPSSGRSRSARGTEREVPLGSRDLLGEGRGLAAECSPCAQYIEQTFPRLARQSPLARAAGLDLVVAFDVRGPGGGQWSCRWTRGELSYVLPGLEERAAVTYHTDTETFEAVTQGLQTPQEAFFEQRITITGDMETALKLAVLFGEFLRETSLPAHRTEAMTCKPLLSPHR